MVTDVADPSAAGDHVEQHLSNTRATLEQHSSNRGDRPHNTIYRPSINSVARVTRRSWTQLVKGIEDLGEGADADMLEEEKEERGGD